jgi:selenocysteine lyase/cysteine desulfurase
VDVDEVVLIPNATTGINTVLRNLSLLPTDVVIHFSTIYAACHKTLASIAEHTPFQTCAIELTYPIADAKIVSLLKESILKLKGEGKTVRLALFDTVLTFPGARMPWEELTAVCREEEVLSLIDGAHGVGHIDMRHLGSVGVDFLVSNCHKYAAFFLISHTSTPTIQAFSLSLLQNLCLQVCLMFIR